MKPCIERRLELDQYSRLMEELRLEDVVAFKNFTRVELDMFAEIVECVSHIIRKQDTSYRKAGSRTRTEGRPDPETHSHW